MRRVGRRSGKMSPVSAGGGRHAGARRAEPTTPSVDAGRVALLAAALTVSLVAWGYLVWLAVDFGATARGGSPGAWWLLVLTGIGAIACLFLALMVLAQLATALGLIRGEPEQSRAPGGRRRAR